MIEFRQFNSTYISSLFMVRVWQMACEDFKKLKEKKFPQNSIYCIYDFKKHHSIVMIHWSIKLGRRSCSITFHILYLLLCSPHVSYFKKNPLTILICLLSSVFQDQELVLFLLGVSYTPAPPNQFFLWCTTILGWVWNQPGEHNRWKKSCTKFFS